MKRIYFALLLCMLSSMLFAVEGRRFTFVIQGGTNIGLNGHNMSERGYEGEVLEKTTEEYLPGFILNTFQFGIGKEINPNLYLAFVPGIWLSDDYERFAFTPASVYGKYAFLNSQITPVVTMQAGIFIEQPISLFGFMVNPAIGIEFGKHKLKCHITAGYLYTQWGQNASMIDDTGDAYLSNDLDVRHSISVSTGITF